MRTRWPKLKQKNTLQKTTNIDGEAFSHIFQLSKRLISIIISIPIQILTGMWYPGFVGCTISLYHNIIIMTKGCIWLSKVQEVNKLQNKNYCDVINKI